MTTKIKICGITRAEDARAAQSAGASAVGMVFWPGSKRAVTMAQAMEVAKVIQPFTQLVGLFVDADPEWVSDVCSQIPLNILQFHGAESPRYCEQFDRPYFKAIRMRPDIDINELLSEYASAQGLLCDTYKPGVPGGTGETFDWDLLPQHHPGIILAGGLTALNVGDAVTRVHPYAVDVSGGVEISPGVKDADKIRAFASAVNSADQGH